MRAILADTHQPLCAELFLYVIVMSFLSEGALYKVVFKVEQLWSLSLSKVISRKPSVISQALCGVISLCPGFSVSLTEGLISKRA